jgi:trimeric autotransporter adhesin
MARGSRGIVVRGVAVTCAAFFALTGYAAAGAPTIHTVAGNGTQGFGGDHGLARHAKLDLPVQAAPLPNGGMLIADKKNFCIRRVSPKGRITTVAGVPTVNGYNGDSKKATHAELSYPTGVAPLAHGAFMIADSGNDRIRVVSSRGIIHTVAGSGVFGFNGDGHKAKKTALAYPARVVPLPHGAILFTDFDNNRVREVTPKGIVRTIAGDGTAASGGDGGPATDAEIYGPSTAVPTANGGILISEFGLISPGTNASRIRFVNRKGIIHTVAGIGTDGYSGDGQKAVNAMLDHPTDAEPLPNGGFLIADYNNNRIREVTPKGKIKTVAGDGTAGFSGDGHAATSAEIDHPTEALPTKGGGFLIADFFNNRIRKVSGSH